MQGYSGDGALAVNAALTYPYGLAVDGVGNVYIGDKKISPGASGFAGDAASLWTLPGCYTWPPAD